MYFEATVGKNNTLHNNFHTCYIEACYCYSIVFNTIPLYFVRNILSLLAKSQNLCLGYDIMIWTGKAYHCSIAFI